MISKDEVRRLQELDNELISTFARRCPSARQALRWRNDALKRYARQGYTKGKRFRELEVILSQKGLFDIRIERKAWADSDGERRVHTLARAALTDMWPMGTHYWLRDNAIIGARFISAGDARRQAIGKELLLSGMSFISSVAQLERFQGVIRSKKTSFSHDAMNWPYIFSAIKDNLTCQKREGWAHKQDAWQILGWHVLEALESGALRHGELTKKHRRFLGYIVPFLAKVSFWKCENSGSWEEIPAIRTSVRAWEHRLIVRLGELSKQTRFSFLSKAYLQERRYLPRAFRSRTLEQTVRHLDKLACRAMLKDLPFESPCYKKSDARYRRGDGALVYLLEIDYAEFLANRCGKDATWSRRIERRLLAEVLRLQDSRTGGIARYSNDSYQRQGFFRHLTVAKLSELYGAPSGDASSHFVGRGQIVPKGRRAAWTHFVWQLAAWAGQRYQKTHDRYYRQLHEKFFNQGLMLVTGTSECSIDFDSKGRGRVIRIPAWKMPECYIADRDRSGRELVFPSPHTPLNWATAEMLAAFVARRWVLLRGDR